MKSLFIAFTFLFLIKAQSQDLSCVSLFAQSQNIEFSKDQIEAMYRIAESQVRASRLPMNDPTRDKVQRDIKEQILNIGNEIGNVKLVNKIYRSIVMDLQLEIREGKIKIEKQSDANRELGQQRRAFEDLQTEIKRIMSDYGTSNLSNILIIASEIRKRGDIEILLKTGLDINAVGKFGMTALQMAAHMGNLDIARLLLENGANINAVDTYNSTALHHATLYSDVKSVLFLLEHKANINMVNSHNETVLHIAVQSGNKKLIKLLVQNGIDLFIKNYKQETALDVAREMDSIWLDELSQSMISMDIMELNSFRQIANLIGKLMISKYLKKEMKKQQPRYFESEILQKLRNWWSR